MNRYLQKLRENLIGIVITLIIAGSVILIIIYIPGVVIMPVMTDAINQCGAGCNLV